MKAGRRVNYKGTAIPPDRRKLQRQLNVRIKRAELYASFLDRQQGYDADTVELVAMGQHSVLREARQLSEELNSRKRGRPQKRLPGGLLAQVPPPPRAKGRPVVNGPVWHAAVVRVVEQERDRLSQGRGTRASVSEAITAALKRVLAPRWGGGEKAALQQFEKTRHAYRKGIEAGADKKPQD